MPAYKYTDHYIMRIRIILILTVIVVHGTGCMVKCTILFARDLLSLSEAIMPPVEHVLVNKVIARVGFQ